MPDIMVNDSDWNSIPPDAQSQIQSIISQQLPGANIVPDPGGISLGGSFSAEDAAEALGLSAGANQSCIDVCNAAGAVATTACAALGNPIAVGICISIAQLATAICRSQCK